MKVPDNKALILMFCISTVFAVLYQAQGTPSVLPESQKLDTSRIDKFIQENLPNAMVGILVQDPKTEKILYQHNANKTFTPASNLKIFTSAVAIQALGQDYQFNTLLKTDTTQSANQHSLNTTSKTSASKASKELIPVINAQSRAKSEDTVNGVIRNLYIQFNGDPSLTSADLKALIINTIKRYQIKKITGNIILDTTQYQAPYYPFGWSWEDLAWYFAAPITSIIIDENKVKLRVVSNKKLGEKAEIYFEENDKNDGNDGNDGNDKKMNLKKSYINLKSTVVSVAPEIAETECSMQVSMDQKNSAVLSGCWPQHSESDNISLAVQNPTLIAETILRETLNELKIQWSNKIVLGKSPQSAEFLAQHSSKPLKKLLQSVLEDSNNLYAESILKTLGLKKLGQGTFLAGLQIMKAILTDEFDLKVNEFRIADGSGGSRYTQITPIQMGMVLNKIYHSSTLFPIFWELLPKWSQSGTLKSRKNDSILTRTVRAKTGYMSGVSTLSGYFTPSPNQPLIFVIMINNSIEESNKLREFQEALLLHFLETLDE